jgi:hypothetical protein
MIDQIEIQIEVGLSKLSPHLREWVEKHLITPHPIKLSLDENGKTYETFWLVTDHVGFEDGSYRVVYDFKKNSFGLESKLQNGINWYMGQYGDFAEAIENM